MRVAALLCLATLSGCVTPPPPAPAYLSQPLPPLRRAAPAIQEKKLLAAQPERPPQPQLQPQPHPQAPAAPQTAVAGEAPRPRQAAPPPQQQRATEPQVAPRQAYSQPGLFYPARANPIGCVSRSAVDLVNIRPNSSDREGLALWNARMDAGQCFPAIGGTAWIVAGINTDGIAALMLLIDRDTGRPFQPALMLNFFRRDMADAMGRHPWLAGDPPPEPGEVSMSPTITRSTQ